ncbi:ROK family protein [Desemzia sp. FAM 23989]|uniref:ROK family protein n=1 Tax=Desemzia sp. FAM 23989 TaxID=3259523 RepID=UPI0038888F28
MLYPHGKDCPCGNKGCLEQYSSQRAVLAALQQLKNDSTLSLADLITFYKSGDPETIQLIEEFAFHISIGINNAIASYGPEKVYLNSTLINEIPALLPLIRKNIVSSFSLKTPIENSLLGEEAILLGGAALSIQQFFHLPTFPLIPNSVSLTN